MDNKCFLSARASCCNISLSHVWPTCHALLSSAHACDTTTYSLNWQLNYCRHYHTRYFWISGCRLCDSSIQMLPVQSLHTLFYINKIRFVPCPSESRFLCTINSNMAQKIVMTILYGILNSLVSHLSYSCYLSVILKDLVMVDIQWHPCLPHLRNVCCLLKRDTWKMIVPIIRLRKHRL